MRRFHFHRGAEYRPMQVEEKRRSVARSANLELEMTF